VDVVCLQAEEFDPKEGFEPSTSPETEALPIELQEIPINSKKRATGTFALTVSFSTPAVN
jgi:hypothetical protein